VVEDNGAVDRARADFWPDDAIRDVAALYGTTNTELEGEAA
jgi:hypothetical protein